MGQQVTLGGDRLGSGNKQKVELHDYEMTSFNLSQDFKSSLAPGILYPFLRCVATNHGTFDVDLDNFIRTLPTVGPLFGSFKFQADIFAVPFRLYQGILHNNNTKVGMNMNKIFLPKIRVRTAEGVKAPRVLGSNDYNYQINDSALLKYDGLSGIGQLPDTDNTGYVERKFQCIPELAYYDIFKNYYANKQEEYAYVITPGTPIDVEATFNRVVYNSNVLTKDTEYYSWSSKFECNNLTKMILDLHMNETLANNDFLHAIKLNITLYDVEGNIIGESSSDDTLQELLTNDATYLKYEKVFSNHIRIKSITSIRDWLEADGEVAKMDILISIDQQAIDREYFNSDIQLTPFKLQNIDDMRDALLCANKLNQEFVIGLGANDNWGASSGSDETGLPYSALVKRTNEGITWNAFTQNGLVVKTYQSDLFNNWLDTEYIDGESGISAISSVAVVAGKFSMDSLNLAEKIYEYLNRVLISGATYEDWQEATYGQGAVRKAETPMYVGGMSCEIMFEEVVATTENSEANQALGSLGGKGRQTEQKGGHNIHVKCDEPCYLIGIVSITPRICYSQGNDWDRTELDTMDDLHKPAMDGIGFQDLMVEQMAWWDTIMRNGTEIFHRSSAGKQVAWQNYMTAVDKCYGDFAKQDGYAFMVLNRNYEASKPEGGTQRVVKDITTYIDPAKFNYAFAQTDLSAQNFWVEIYSHVTARRKMSGKQIPNV